MFQNNNGAIVKRLARNSLKANKKRDRLVMIIIALVVCLMMTFSLAVTGMMQIRKNSVKDAAQIVFYKVDENTTEQLRQEPDVDWVGENIIVWKSKMKDAALQINYESKELYSKEILKAQEWKFEGELPQQKNDIVVMPSFLAYIGSNAKIGDTVLLDLGDDVERKYKITGLMSTDIDTGNNYAIDVSKTGAQMLLNSKNLTVNANIRLKNPETISKEKAAQMANEIASKYSIPKENVVIQDTYFDLMNTKLESSDMVFAGIALILLLGAGIVIYTIFYISVSGKTKEYGQLRTVGMTRKQIRKLVGLEGGYLSAIGILPGLALGGIIGFLIAPDGWRFSVALVSAAVISILTFLTVTISVRVPAKMASQISPVEATRYSTWNSETKSSKKLHRSLTPSHLALMNFTRNRKKAILTVISLAFSGILLLCFGTLSSSYNAENAARKSFPYGELRLVLADNDFSTTANDEWADSLQKINNPLNSSLKEKITSIDGVSGIRSEEAMRVKFTLPEGTALSGTIKGFDMEDADIMQTDVIAGTLDYDALYRENGIAVAQYGIRDYTPKLGDKISLEFLKADGTTATQEFTIMTILSDYPNPYGNPIALPSDTMNRLSGIDCTNSFYIKTDPQKLETVQEALKGIVSSNDNFELTTFQDTVNYNRSTMETGMNILYGIGFMIGVFGLINLLNTTVTNFISRQREIGILQAVGLARKQLASMLRVEGLFYTAGASALTLTLGSLLGYAACSVLTKKMGAVFHYSFPIIPTFGFVVFMLLIQLIISSITVRNLKKQSLVERIEQS